MLNIKKRYLSDFSRKFFFLASILYTAFLHAQSITTTTVSGSSPYCAGSAVNVTYTVSGTFSNTPTANVFTAELSDIAGGFGSPVAIGTRTATNGGVIGGVIPYNTATGSLYRIRVSSSNPSVFGSDNGYNLTVNAPTISTPTVSSAQLCQNEIFNVSFNKTCNFNVGNVFTFQLSDPFGSFSSPVTITSYTSTAAGSFSMTVPGSASGGTGYRVRVVSSVPVITSADNGSNIVISAASGTPSVFGTSAWNAYCYNGLNNFSTNYQGFYTENNLSIASTGKWVNTNSPSTATGTNGLAYSGCPFGNTNYSVNYKRTNFTCGYYQVDITGHDDNVYLFINGVNVFQHLGCCDAHINVWSGFINPAMTIEFRFSNGGGPGYLTANFVPINPLTLSAPATICSGSSTSITVNSSSTATLNYSWSPAASLNTATLSSVVASPTVTTTYSVTGTDGVTGCSVTNTVTTTINALPTTTVTTTYTAICNGITSTTLTAGGANSYTWAPASGLNTTTGNSVIANPSVTTVYTVSGSNNCSVVSATKTVIVQNPPVSPSQTVFGSGTWNVSCNNNQTFNNYYGYYTENNLSFDTQARWNSNNGPSTCTTTSTGLAYSGCTFGGTLWSMSFRRTNIPCGYYQVDIPGHDDNVGLYINGVLSFSHAGCCDSHTAVWTGFIGPSTTVEFQLINGTGPGYMSANFIMIPYPVLNPPVTICPSTSATLSANFIAGASYSWAPPAALSSPSGYTTVASPGVTTSFTCTVTDPVTTCSASANVLITVSPTSTTTVSPTAATISCASNVYTLTASGANTYTWLPAAGLSATTGFSVLASPSITTVYTVTGSDNCLTSSATTTMNALSLITPAIFPANTWNAYCYGDQTLTNYYGYYTENGSGTSGYNFNTATRFSSVTPIPSNANSTNGLSYSGCVLNSINWAISFKRTGFTCGTYAINVFHDDFFYLFINGTQVAQHTNGVNDTHNGIWTGVLNPNSTVEFRLVQVTGNSAMSVTLAPVASATTQSTWIGSTSTDWFTGANWCGYGIPSFSTNVVIAAAGPQYMPVITVPGAQCNTITISPAIVAGTYNAAIPAASLSISGSNNLDVYGDWNNGGVFSSGTGTINLSGSANTTFSCPATFTQSIYNLTLNKTGSVTVNMSGGVHNISNSLVFTNGIINQNSVLQILNGAAVSGQSNAGFVNGPVVKIGNSAFTFPVGTGGIYRPIAISAPTLATDNFVAQYYIADPDPTYSSALKDPTLDHISRCEYWILNRALGVTSNVSVTMTWDVNSCSVTVLSDLRVARWDAGQVKWKDQGNGGTTGNTTTGSIITSGPVTNFSPFTLASSSLNNPLPITLKSFNCMLSKSNYAELNWITATEFNNDYFFIESSADGINFETIGKVKGAGNSHKELKYNFKDNTPLKKIVYYRLKQTDFDGAYTYSSICYVGNNQQLEVTIYPNPASSELTIEYNGLSAISDNIIITNALGQQVNVIPIFLSHKMLVNTSGLSNGIYFIEIRSGGKTMTNKIIIQNNL